MRAGRIGSYIHSDSITAAKGGAMVCMLCDTDFGARTDAFMAFADRAARMAYAASAADWAGVVSVFPEMEDERLALSRSLKESVTMSEVSVLGL